MSVLPIEKVRGEDWVAEPSPVNIPANIELRTPLQIAQTHEINELQGAELATWLDRTVYRLRTGDTVHLTDAVTGQLLSPLNQKNALAVAQHDYAGPGTAATAHLLNEPLLEIRGRDLPVWQINFDDSRHTTVYVSVQSGKVVGRRNTIWRVYDFFWMLHIMDYGARDNFNNPLVITAAVIAWFLATSGIWLVVVWLQRKSKRRRAA